MSAQIQTSCAESTDDEADSASPPYAGSFPKSASYERPKPIRIRSAQTKFTRSLTSASTTSLSSMIDESASESTDTEDQLDIENSVSCPSLSLIEDRFVPASSFTAASSSTSTPLSEPPRRRGVFPPSQQEVGSTLLDLCFSRAHDPDAQNEQALDVSAKRLLARARLKLGRMLLQDDYLLAYVLLGLQTKLGLLQQDTLLVTDACPGMHILPLIASSLKRDVASELAVATLFRDDSPSLQLIKGCLQRHGALFLQALFSKRFESYHAGFLRGKKELAVSQTKLRYLVLSIEYLISSIDLVPPIFAAICASVFRHISSLCPSTPRDDLSRQTICALLLLHYFCPRLVNLRSSSTKVSSQQYGTCVAKYLLQLASQSLSASEEPGASLLHLAPSLLERGKQVIAKGEALLNDAEAMATLYANKANNGGLRLFAFIKDPEILSTLKTAIETSTFISTVAARTLVNDLDELANLLPLTDLKKIIQFAAEESPRLHTV